MQGRCAGSASGAWRAIVAFAACWVIVLPAIVPADAAARARHRPKVRHVCTRAKVPTIGKHGKHRKPRRIRYCVTIRPINHAKLQVQTRSGGFTPPPLGFSVPDQGETAPLPVGPFRPLGHPVVKRRVLGVVVPTAGNALPPTLPIDVGFAATHLITPDETPARKHDTLGCPGTERGLRGAGRDVHVQLGRGVFRRRWEELDGAGPAHGLTHACGGRVRVRSGRSVRPIDQGLHLGPSVRVSAGREPDPGRVGECVATRAAGRRRRGRISTSTRP